LGTTTGSIHIPIQEFSSQRMSFGGNSFHET
jgi:hypothetical protein